MMGIGLAMDCCAVSAVQGMAQKSWHPRALLMALIFGSFHLLMPVIGYYAGQLFVDFMKTYSPWIALALLGFLGCKMIWESFRKKKNGKKANWSMINLLLLAIATSIDVLATGLIFVPYAGWLWPAVLTIGGITALFSIGGYLIGAYVGKQQQVHMDILGGLVLITLGIKIWAEGYLI